MSDSRCKSDCRSRGHEFDPGPVPYFVEIDHEIISTVSYKQKYVHEVLVNCLYELAQEKVWLGELTVPP